VPAVAGVRGADPGRLPSIDTLRAIAVAGVVAFHAAAHHAPRTYVLHRLFRIYPAYWTALLAVTALRHNWPTTGEDWPFFALDLAALSHLNAHALLRFDVLGISWTLTVELVWYALAPLLVRAAGRREPAWGTLLVPFAALSCLWVWAAEQGWLDWFVSGFASAGLLPLPAAARFVFVTNQFPAHLALFVLGAALRTHEASLARVPALLLVACVVPLAGWPHTVDHWLGIRPSLVSGFGMAALMLLALRGSLPAFAAVGWIGRVSYPIFLVHVPIMQWIHGPLGLEGIASFAAALAGIVAASWALHRLVEEPGIRLGRRLGGARVSPRP